MDEDTKDLDWGHEEDDYQSYDTRRSCENIGEPRHYADKDCNDTVSLGGDEGDLGVIYAHQFIPGKAQTEVSRYHSRDHQSSDTGARQLSRLSPHIHLTGSETDACTLRQTRSCIQVAKGFTYISRDLSKIDDVGRSSTRKGEGVGDKKGC